MSIDYKEDLLDGLAQMDYEFQQWLAAPGEGENWLGAHLLRVGAPAVQSAAGCLQDSWGDAVL